ncbi:MAG: hypothetical protein PHD72_02010 [Patescibacteria group bacterium]|nr:hypothetical protein [Patescibacteria group bacterium]
MKNLQLAAFFNALGVSVYVAIVVLIMQNAERIFGKVDNLLGPVTLLMLFVVSAAITGALVLGKPVLYYLDNKKAEAVKLFLYTVGWLFVLVVAALMIQAFA